MKALKIDLISSSVPAYQQIAGGVRRHLVDGSLKAGDVLPPVRQLALDLGVHFNTVAEAYRQLAQEGWLDLKRRRGALVLDRRVPRSPDARKVQSLFDRLSDIAAELRAAGVSKTDLAVALRQVAKGQRP